MNKKERLCFELHKELLHFTDRVENILDVHHLNSDDIIYIKFFLSNINANNVMQHVIKNILPWKKQIQERDDQFFYKNKEIFGKLPETKVNYFSDMWMSEKFEEDDKNEFWDFFDTFITFAEVYKKEV